MGTYEKKRKKFSKKLSLRYRTLVFSSKDAYVHHNAIKTHIDWYRYYLQPLKSTVFFKEFLQFFVFLGISYIRPLKEPTSTSVTTCKNGSSWIQT